jgi:hypothetical protein
MIEVDENDKIETVNLDLDQGDCVGHVGGVIGGGVSLCVCVCVMWKSLKMKAIWPEGRDYPT